MTIAIIIAVLTAGILLASQILIRLMANKGIFFVRVPEMTALAIMKDRILHKIFVACSDQVWKEITDCPSDKTPLTKLIRLRKGLKYIGPPWIYTVYEWYFTRKDQDAASVKPLHSLSLSVLNIQYEPESVDKENGTPNLKTGDGVEVAAKLVAYIVIRDPEKALFNIDHIKTFIRGQIMAEWRDVTAEFQFFQYLEAKEGETAEIYLRGAMEELNTKLRDKIGITPFDEKKNICEIAQTSGKVEKILCDSGGIVLLDIALVEFEAADPEVEKALEEMLKGKAAAQKLIQVAMGEKRSKILQGQGEQEYIMSVAKAIKDSGREGQFLQALKTVEKATENLSKAGNLTVFGLGEILGPVAQYLKSGLLGGESK